MLWHFSKSKWRPMCYHIRRTHVYEETIVRRAVFFSTADELRIDEGFVNRENPELYMPRNKTRQQRCLLE